MKIIFDAIDEQPVSALPRQRRAGLRNWQIAIVYAMIHTGAMTTVVTLATGDNALGMLSLAIHGLALGLALAAGAMMRLL